MSFDASLDSCQMADIAAEVEALSGQVSLVLDANTIDLTLAAQHFSQIVELYVLDDTHKDLEAIGALRTLRTLHLRSLSKRALATLPHLSLDQLVVDSPKVALIFAVLANPQNYSTELQNIVHSVDDVTVESLRTDVDEMRRTVNVSSGGFDISREDVRDAALVVGGALVVIAGSATCPVTGSC